MRGEFRVDIAPSSAEFLSRMVSSHGFSTQAGAQERKVGALSGIFICDLSRDSLCVGQRAQLRLAELNDGVCQRCWTEEEELELTVRNHLTQLQRPNRGVKAPFKSFLLLQEPQKMKTSRTSVHDVMSVNQRRARITDAAKQLI